MINASTCGLLETARQHLDRIAKVYAGRNGIIGALTEDLIDTSVESKAAIAALNTPRVLPSDLVTTSLGRLTSTALNTSA